MSKRQKNVHFNDTELTSQSLSSDCQLFIEINRLSNSLSKHYPQHNIYTIIKEYDIKYPCMHIRTLIHHMKNDYPLISNQSQIITELTNNNISNGELDNLQWLTGC